MKDEQKPKTCEPENIPGARYLPCAGDIFALCSLENGACSGPGRMQVILLQILDGVIGAKLAVDEIARHTPVPAVLTNETVQSVEYFGLHSGHPF